MDNFTTPVLIGCGDPYQASQFHIPACGRCILSPSPGVERVSGQSLGEKDFRGFLKGTRSIYKTEEFYIFLTDCYIQPKVVENLLT